jgi:hypothetical protein
MFGRTSFSKQNPTSLNIQPDGIRSRSNDQEKELREGRQSIAKLSALVVGTEKLKSDCFLINNNFIQGSSVDPFARTPVAMNTDYDILLKYYLTAQMEGGNLLNLSFFPSHVRNIVRPEVIRDEIVTNAILHKQCFYALMAFMSVRMSVISKTHLTALKPAPYYMYLAISALREKILEHQKSQSMVDRKTICGMLQIALAEWTAGNLVAARTHIRVLVQLMPVSCLKDDQGMNLTEIIRVLDLEVALELSSMPFLAPPKDPDPIPSFHYDQITQRLKIALENHERNRESVHNACKQYNLSSTSSKPTYILADVATTLDLRLGYGYEEAINPDILDENFAPILRDLIQCLAVAKYIWCTPYATTNDARWMCRTARSVVHRLTIYSCDRRQHMHTSTSALTECTRFALLIMLTLAMNRMADRAVTNLGQELRLACARVDRNVLESDMANKVFLWTLVTGAFALRNSSKDELWFIHQAAHLSSSRLGLASSNALHETMTLFLYSCSMQMPTLNRVIAYLHAIRESERH